jgi:hypothetical protein
MRHLWQLDTFMLSYSSLSYTLNSSWVPMLQFGHSRTTIVGLTILAVCFLLALLTSPFFPRYCQPHWQYLQREDLPMHAQHLDLK